MKNKNKLNKLASAMVLSACLTASFSAHAVPPEIKVLFVFTDAGRAQVELTGTMLSFAIEQIRYTNEVYARSAANVTFKNAGTYGGNGFFNPPVWSIIDTTYYTGYKPDTYPGDIGAVKTAMANPAVMQARDDAKADIVIVVAEYNNIIWGDGSYGDINGYSGGNCTTNATAYLGVNASSAMFIPDVVPHELGHHLCAEHADGYALNFGSHLEDCVQYFDVMGKSQPFPIPQITWKAPAQLSGAPHGYGTSAQGAFDNMTAHCPDVSTVAIDYTCINTIPCVMNGSQDAATCWFDVNNFIKLPPPGYNIRAPINQAGGANKLISTGQCLNKQAAGRFSNPATYIFPGIPFGTATKNAVAKINAKAAEVAAYRN